MNDFSQTTAPIRATVSSDRTDLLPLDPTVRNLAARVATLEQRQDALEGKMRARWLKVRRALLMVAEHIKDEWGL